MDTLDQYYNVRFTYSQNKNPDETKYYRRRGRCHLRLQNVHTAMDDFRKMILLDPQNRNNRNYFRNTLLSPEVLNQVSEGDTKEVTLYIFGDNNKCPFFKLVSEFLEFQFNNWNL